MLFSLIGSSSSSNQSCNEDSSNEVERLRRTLSQYIRISRVPWLNHYIDDIGNTYTSNSSYDNYNVHLLEIQQRNNIENKYYPLQLIAANHPFYNALQLLRTRTRIYTNMSSICKTKPESLLPIIKLVDNEYQKNSLKSTSKRAREF